MKKFLKLFLAETLLSLLCTNLIFANENTSVSLENVTFNLQAHVFDWGQNITAIEIDLKTNEADLASLDTDTFTVRLSAVDPINIGEDISLGVYEGERNITGINVSEEGNIIISLEYGSDVAGAGTLTYVLGAGRNLDMVLNYTVVQNKEYTLNDGTVISAASTYAMGSIIDEEAASFKPGISSSGINYQLFTPDADAQSHPLIVWFHGNGEGGINGYQNNISQLLANRGAVSFVTEEMQLIFGGAYILAPQVEDSWYYNYEKGYLDQASALIMEIIQKNPSIDTNRIYVAGASSGGYMTWHMLAANPDMFAAAAIVCAAIDIAPLRGGAETTDEILQSAANTPIWLVHSADDSVVSVDKSSRRAYSLLQNCDVIYTEFDNVTVDGNNYSGHSAWVYFANNIPVNNDESIMAWMARQNNGVCETEAGKITTDIIFNNPANPNSYIVQPGDVLWKIAQIYNTTWQTLANYNELSNPHRIYPGQVLLIP